MELFLFICCVSSLECKFYEGFTGDSDGKDSACNAGDLGSIPGSERSPGEINSKPLQYSCLESSMNGGEKPGGLQPMESQRVGHD